MLSLRQLAQYLPFLLFSFPTWAQDAIEQTLTQYYAQYSASQKCHLAKNEEGLFCLREDARQTISTDNGKQLYLLMRGNAIDPETHEEGGAHIQTGMVGMFVFQQKGASWQPSHARADIFVGAFGNAPKDWQLHQFGSNTWGFLNTAGDVHQGYSGSKYLILFPEDQSDIAVYGIPAAAANTAAKICEAAANPQACLNETYELDSQLRIRHDMPANDGIYPLQLTVNGHEGTTKYRNKKYIARFHRPKGYLLPREYPVQNYDY